MARGLKFTLKQFQDYQRKTKTWRKSDWESFYKREDSPPSSNTEAPHANTENSVKLSFHQVVASRLPSRKTQPARVPVKKDDKGMNGTERRYAENLDRLILAGEIVNWWYEQHKEWIADGKCWYTPDFLVQKSDGNIEYHEVKGSPSIFQDDAKVKCKVYATNGPIPLYIVYPEGKSWKKVKFP